MLRSIIFAVLIIITPLCYSSPIGGGMTITEAATGFDVYLTLRDVQHDIIITQHQIEILLQTTNIDPYRLCDFPGSEYIKFIKNINSEVALHRIISCNNI